MRDAAGSAVAGSLAAGTVLLFIALATPKAQRGRQAFVAVGTLLFLACVATRDDWPALGLRALSQGAFIGAFFVALASLRSPASTSPAIARCGRYLATQPPGRRYLALTGGGHLFALVLSYGAITLLGGLTESVTRQETDPEIRTVRNRRMLLAIQRGFVASLAWSPLAFAMAVTTSLVPHSSWSGAAPFALVNAALLTLVGWRLDSRYKPKVPRAVPLAVNTLGTIRDAAPLFVLLLVLFAGVGVVELLTGLKFITVVMALVPVVALGWIALQARGETAPQSRFTGRLQRLALVDVPSYAPEILLLAMAGIIGTLGAALIEPWLAGSGARLDLAALPTPAILAGLVLLVPLLGQLGMNPILSVSLFAPLLPSAQAMGVSPNAVVVAITAGWALAGASSPFTATTLLVGRLGEVSALHVGIVWNRSFMAVATLVLLASVLVAAHLMRV
ncbi:hypothetical protein ASG48_03625 [Aurantimonas sp. Leaf443]|nr:hypothetical protein ASG48_03625 [Aurantimonas sp. Leaf443]